MTVLAYSPSADSAGFPPPRLDPVGMEQARLVRLAWEQLATSETSVDYASLAIGRASTGEAARQWVSRHRSSGRLFTVDYAGGVLIPRFQLNESYSLDPEVGDAVAVLSRLGMSGWEIWQWFTSLNPWIEARPVDVIGTETLTVALDKLITA